MKKDRKFQSLLGAFHCNFSRLNEVTSPHSVSVTLAKGPDQDKALRAEGIHVGRHRCALACPRNGTEEMKGEGEAKAEEERGNGSRSCSNDPRFFEGLSVR